MRSNAAFLAIAALLAAGAILFWRPESAPRQAVPIVAPDTPRVVDVAPDATEMPNPEPVARVAPSSPALAAPGSDVDRGRPSVPHRSARDPLPPEVQAYLERTGQSEEVYRQHQAAKKLAMSAQRASLGLEALGWASNSEGDMREAEDMYSEVIEAAGLSRDDLSATQRAAVLDTLADLAENLERVSRECSSNHAPLRVQDPAQSLGTQAKNAERMVQMLAELDPAVQSLIAGAEDQITFVLGPASSRGYLERLVRNYQQ